MLEKLVTKAFLRACNTGHQCARRTHLYPSSVMMNCPDREEKVSSGMCRVLPWFNVAGEMIRPINHLRHASGVIPRARTFPI